MEIQNTQRRTAADVPAILGLIRGLAEYEKLIRPGDGHGREASRNAVWRPPRRRRAARLRRRECAGFALFFPNYSTFLAKPGIFLEDLYVKPDWRGKGIGQALLLRVRGHRAGTGLRPARMGSARLERAVDRVLQEPGRRPDGRMDKVPRDRRSARKTRGTRFLGSYAFTRGVKFSEAEFMQ